MRVEIQGKYLRFLEYKSSEFKHLCKLLTWEDEYSKSRGVSQIESLLFEDEVGYYTFAKIIDLIEDEFSEFDIVKDDRKDLFQIIDVREDILDGITLRDYQLMAVRKSVCMKRGLIEIPTAGGKCFGKGTKILMFDGTIKKVEDIIVGDLLMGDDSYPRKVVSLAHGREELFKITPKKGNFYIVNKSHIMSFRVTNHPQCRINGISLKGGELIDIPLTEYFSLKKTHRHVLKGYRVPVDFPEQSVDIDPYFLGVWLGDGRSDSLSINTPDHEIVDFINDYAASLGMKVSIYPDPGSKADNYAIVRSEGYFQNKLLDMFRNYDLIGDYQDGDHPQCHKHIPHCYKANSRSIRFHVLAGLLDTDGYLHPSNYFDLTLFSKKLTDDAMFLAQSLGFGTTRTIKVVKGIIYQRLHIYGDVGSIPTKVAHKKASPRLQKKSVLMMGITIKSIGEGEYFGFELEGNNKRFLLEDCTVVHNTEISLGIYKTLIEQGLVKRALIVTPSVPIVRQFYLRALQRGFSRNDIGFMYGKQKDFNKPLTFAVVNTLAQGIKAQDSKFINLVKEADLIIFDEAHHARADSFVSVARASESEYLIGMSGTPFKDRANLLESIGDTTIYGLIGKIIFKVSQQSLVNQGYIADTAIFMKPVKGAFKKYRAQYQKIYSREIVDNRGRNEHIIEYINYFVSCGLTVLVSVNIKDHALELMRRLKKESPNIVPITIFGGSEAHVYNENNWIESYTINHDAFITDFENGEYDVIFATQVFDEGVDLPSVGALIMGGAGKSLRQVRQRLGRGVRSKKTGKNVVFILDFFDRGHIWMFQQSKKRLSIYLDEVESDVIETEYEFRNLIKSCKG